MQADNVIEEITALADKVFRPMAEVADRGETGDQLATNIRVLAERGFFGLGIGREYGGLGADGETRREYGEIIASACGVTAFTQQQFHTGVGFARSAMSDSIKAWLIPKLATGEQLCGVGFSHLRRPGNPMVIAERVDGGFRVNGSAPWVTGWSLIDGFMLGATLPSDSGIANLSGRRHLFAWVPKAGNESALEASDPISLHVMNASDTVEVSIRDLFVPVDHIISEGPAEELRRNDYCGITGHVFHPLGCARGSIHYLRELAVQRKSQRWSDVADSFQREVDDCRREALTWNGSRADLPEYKENALRARTGAIELAVRAAHATVAATGGTAQMLDRPPQRLMREAVFYTTLAQTPDVQTGTIERLTHPRNQ